MMKKVFLSVFVVLISFTLVGCGKKDMPVENNMNKVSNVTLEIVEDSISKSGLTVVIKAPQGSTFVQWFRIDKKGKNKWEEVKKTGDGPSFSELAYEVGESGQMEMVQNWEEFYGKLKKGEYRIVKKVLIDDSETQYISAEFKIK